MGGLAAFEAYSSGWEWVMCADHSPQDIILPGTMPGAGDITTNTIQCLPSKSLSCHGKDQEIKRQIIITLPEGVKESYAEGISFEVGLEE